MQSCDCETCKLNKYLKVQDETLLTICINHPKHIIQSQYKKRLESCIKQLKQNDKLKNRKSERTEKIINLQWLYKMYNMNHGKCSSCHKVMHAEDVSIDRIDNTLPHIESNCRLLHKRCHLKASRGKYPKKQFKKQITSTTTHTPSTEHPTEHSIKHPNEHPTEHSTEYTRYSKRIRKILIETDDKQYVKKRQKFNIICCKTSNR